MTVVAVVPLSNLAILFLASPMMDLEEYFFSSVDHLSFPDAADSFGGNAGGEEPSSGSPESLLTALVERLYPRLLLLQLPSVGGAAAACVVVIVEALSLLLFEYVDLSDAILFVRDTILLSVGVTEELRSSSRPPEVGVMSSSGDVGSRLILVGVVTLDPPSASDREDLLDDGVGI